MTSVNFNPKRMPSQSFETMEPIGKKERVDLPKIENADLPDMGIVEKALRKNEAGKETKKEVGKWLIGIGSFAAVTLAGVLAVGTLLAIVSNPVGWGIGIGLALAMVGVGIFLAAKYNGNWKDVAIPLVVGAAVGLIVVGLIFLVFGSGGKAGIPSGGGFHSPGVGINSGVMLWYFSTPPALNFNVAWEKPEKPKEYLNNKNLDELKNEFSNYLDGINLNEAKIKSPIHLLNNEEQKEDVKKLYKKALRSVKNQKYKKAEALLFKVKEQDKSHPLLREYADVMALAYPKSTDVQLECIKEAPYFKEEGNPRQALHLAKSLYQIGRKEDAKRVLSFAYAIAYKENQGVYYAGVSEKGKMIYEANEYFMKEANRFGRTIF